MDLNEVEAKGDTEKYELLSRPLSLLYRLFKEKNYEESYSRFKNLNLTYEYELEPYQRERWILKNYIGEIKISLATFNLLGLIDENDPCEIITYFEEALNLVDCNSIVLNSEVDTLFHWSIAQSFESVVGDMLENHDKTEVLFITFLAIKRMLSERVLNDKKSFSYLVYEELIDWIEDNDINIGFKESYLPKKKIDYSANDYPEDFVYDYINLMNMVKGGLNDDRAVCFLQVLIKAYILNYYLEDKCWLPTRYKLEQIGHRARNESQNRSYFEEDENEKIEYLTRIYDNDVCNSIDISPLDKVVDEYDKELKVDPYLELNHPLQNTDNKSFDALNIVDRDDKCGFNYCIFVTDESLFNGDDPVLSDILPEIKAELPELKFVVLSNKENRIRFRMEKLPKYSGIDFLFYIEEGRAYWSLINQFIKEHSAVIDQVCLIGSNDDTLAVAKEFGLFTILQRTSCPRKKLDVSLADYDFLFPEELLDFFIERCKFKNKKSLIVSDEPKPNYKHTGFAEFRKFAAKIEQILNEKRSIKTCILEADNTLFRYNSSSNFDRELGNVFFQIKKINPTINIVLLSNSPSIEYEEKKLNFEKTPIDEIIKMPGASYAELLSKYLNENSCCRNKTCLIGNDEYSIKLAYEFGLLAVLHKSNWLKANYKSKSYLPDFEYEDPESLLKYLQNPDAYKPILEQIMDGYVYQPLFIETNRFSPVETSRKGVTIYGLGRHFSGYSYLDLRRKDHKLTQSIHANKDSTVFPKTWIEGIKTFITNKKLAVDRSLLVVSIPARPGRVDRLRSLISQLITSSPEFHLTTISDLLEYDEGIRSNHHEYLNREERFINIRDHLKCKNMSLSNRDVLIIDDVATSGASFYYANKRLMNIGAKRVFCLAIAINISK